MRSSATWISLGTLSVSGLVFALSISEPRSRSLAHSGVSHANAPANSDSEASRVAERLREVEVGCVSTSEASSSGRHPVAAIDPATEARAQLETPVKPCDFEPSSGVAFFSHAPHSRTGLHATPQSSVEQRIAVLQDPYQAFDAKVSALRELQRRQFPDGVDARLAALDGAIAIGRSSLDEAQRAEVWQLLSHVTDPRLRQPLLNALAHDPAARARQEAALSLADFLPDPTVEATLRRAAVYDEDADVRWRAQWSLKHPHAESLSGGH